MPIRLVRNDITKMVCDAVVNTANELPIVGPGCDSAIYRAAGYERLLELRQKIGSRKEGEAFLTPGFGLPAGHIIHTVSPLYRGGDRGEEALLRSCYRNSLAIALEQGFSSVAFPLIATGSFGYPREEGLRIALDEIQAFLLKHEMLIYIVVLGEESTALGEKLFPELKRCIEDAEVQEILDREYVQPMCAAPYREPAGRGRETVLGNRGVRPRASRLKSLLLPGARMSPAEPKEAACREEADTLWDAAEDREEAVSEPSSASRKISQEWQEGQNLSDTQRNALQERLRHREDSFSEYLLYLIESRGMTNAEVYKRAIVDKKAFSKIKNNPEAHPSRTTALCLCIGAKLNLDEAVDLLARAGYALSPHDKTDQIFRFFLEHRIYDMIELDCVLDEYGLDCLIA